MEAAAEEGVAAAEAEVAEVAEVRVEAEQVGAAELAVQEAEEAEATAQLPAAMAVLLQATAVGQATALWGGTAVREGRKALMAAPSAHRQPMACHQLLKIPISEILQTCAKTAGSTITRKGSTMTIISKMEPVAPGRAMAIHSIGLNQIRQMDRTELAAAVHAMEIPCIGLNQMKIKIVPAHRRMKIPPVT